MTSSELQRQPDETRALARLALDELGSVPAGIGGIHRAIAGRVFRYVGPTARVVQVPYDAITSGVYGGLRGASRMVTRAADQALARRPVGEGRTLSITPRGSALIAAINGLIGDTLEREGSELVEPMALRVEGQPVAPDPDALAAAFPHATPRIVVFVHGLMESEFAWRRADRRTYGEQLARDLGVTAVDVRYNTGRRISENGRSLAELLELVADAWPVTVEQIALVGHSMGGLVARSACHQAVEAGMDWVHDVRHVVSLGSPHMGAPLEQAVHYASAGLHALPETRPLANFLRRRSGGIRDLRQGSLVDADWRDHDPDALRAAACEEVPLLEGATHCFVAATITRSPRHPLGRLLGDTLVLQPSASGRSRTRRIGFRDEDGMHLGSAHHFALLNHPLVYERLLDWLATS